MKRTLIILAFIVILSNIFAQKVICHPVGSKKECLLAYKAVKEYINDTSVVIIFNSISPLFLGFNGIMWQYNNGFYQISINAFQTDETERIWTIFHEIGHVIDMEEGRLQQFPLIWKDREYSETIPWEERPWEKSAEKWAYRIWNRLMDTKPPYNKTNIRNKKDCIHIKNNY